MFEDTVEVMVRAERADALYQFAIADDAAPDGVAFRVDPDGYAYARVARRHLGEVSEFGAVEIF